MSGFEIAAIAGNIALAIAALAVYRAHRMSAQREERERIAERKF